MLARLRARLRRYPDPSDVVAVSRMTAAQWRSISTRTKTYCQGYKDRPGSDDRAQRRAEWIAALPVFADAKSVLEIGCGMGRNLAEIRRRYPAMALAGMDINADAIDACETDLPGGQFCQVDLYDLAYPPRDPVRVPHAHALWWATWADVILSVGCLGHLHPEVVARLLPRLWRRAGQALVFVEDEGLGGVVKGPRAWGAAKNTGAYVLWDHPLTLRIRQHIGQDCAPVLLPEDLRAPGARKVWTIGRGRNGSE